MFRYSQETEKVEWLAQRLRPLQTRNSLAASGTIINIHYMPNEKALKARID